MEGAEYSNLFGDPLSDIELYNSLFGGPPDMEYVEPNENIQLASVIDQSTPYNGSINVSQYAPPTQRAENVMDCQYLFTQMTTLCPICENGDAGNHKHYGGKACTSCKAFFRRSVENEAYKIFICANKDWEYLNGINCPINSKSWRSCRYCRFQKCLMSGLQISLVLTPSQRELRKRKRMDNKIIRNNEEVSQISLVPAFNSNTLTNSGFTGKVIRDQRPSYTNIM